MSEQNSWENKTSGKSESLWFANIQPIKFTKLTRNISTDVVIIGGGIAGMTTAYLLSKAEKKVILVEDGYIGGTGETGRTTAHITHALDDRYYNLEKIHGKQGAQKAPESHTAAINLIESIAKEEKIDCEFQRLDGFLFLDPSDKKESLDKELEATHNAGIASTGIIQQSPLPSFDTGPCLRFPNQAQFQPLKYLSRSSGCYNKRSKGEIFTETHVQEINFNDTTTIKTLEGYTINATKIVIATNAPIVNETSKIYDKQEPYRTYVIGDFYKERLSSQGSILGYRRSKFKKYVPPYHYIRIQNVENSESNNLLIVGGEDHKTGETDNGSYEERFGTLERWTRKRFPIENIKYKWSGQVMEPMDSLAFIGHNPGHNGKNLYIATGDSGNGITHGTIAGIILSDSILKKDNPWQDLYNPSRQIQTYTTTQGNEASSLPSSSSEGKQQEEQQQQVETTSPPFSNILVSLSSEQGTVLEDKKITVYKDKTGNSHTYSAVCTHLGVLSLGIVWKNPLIVRVMVRVSPTGEKSSMVLLMQILNTRIYNLSFFQ